MLCSKTVAPCNKSAWHWLRFAQYVTWPCKSSKYLTGQQFIETGSIWLSFSAAEKAFNSQKCLITLYIIGWVIIRNVTLSYMIINRGWHFWLSPSQECNIYILLPAKPMRVRFVSVNHCNGALKHKTRCVKRPITPLFMNETIFLIYLDRAAHFETKIEQFWRKFCFASKPHLLQHHSRNVSCMC